MQRTRLNYSQLLSYPESSPIWPRNGLFIRVRNRTNSGHRGESHLFSRRQPSRRTRLCSTESSWTLRISYTQYTPALLILISSFFFSFFLIVWGDWGWLLSWPPTFLTALLQDLLSSTFVKKSVLTLLRTWNNFVTISTSLNNISYRFSHYYTSENISRVFVRFS